MGLLEQAWEHREEVIYTRLFGSLGKGIYPLTADVFVNVFKLESYDPRWVHYGVFACPPTPTRESWVYVTSGMSNSWEADEPEEYSGLGVEFVLETDENSEWPIIALHRLMAYNILVTHGHFGDNTPLDYGHRIPLRGSIAMDRDSDLQNIAITFPDHYPSSFDLPSGKVDFLHFIGVTNKEIEYAKKTSTEALIARLKEAGVYPLTLPSRASII